MCHREGRRRCSPAPPVPHPTPTRVTPTPALPPQPTPRRLPLKGPFLCHSAFPLGDFCLPERFETSHIFLYK